MGCLQGPSFSGWKVGLFLSLFYLCKLPWIKQLVFSFFQFCFLKNILSIWNFQLIIKSAALSQPLSNQLLPSLTNQLSRPITTVANTTVLPSTSYPNLGFQPIPNGLPSLNDTNNLFPDFPTGRFSHWLFIVSFEPFDWSARIL